MHRKRTFDVSFPMPSFSPLLVLLCAFAVSAQQAANVPTGSQQQRAMAAMERSLAAQQAALDAYRDNGEPASLKQQRESLARQTSSIEGLAAPDQPTPAERSSAPIILLDSLVIVDSVSGSKYSDGGRYMPAHGEN